MENPIKNFLDSQRKKAIKVKLASAETTTKLSPKQRTVIVENINKKYTVGSWLKDKIQESTFPSINSFIPLSQQEELFDFLSLDIGYKHNVKSAFDEKFPLINELLSDLEYSTFEYYREIISSLPKHIIPFYIFFTEEIKTARKQNTSPQQLIAKRIDEISLKAKEGTRVSHASKFTNPEVKWPRIYSISESKKDGLLKTGSVSVDYDMHINAASLQVHKFLSLRVNNCTILDLIENNTDSTILDIFFIDQERLNLWKKAFAQCLENNSDKTDKLLKQIYFPVGGAYHQLSILFPSSLVFCMKEKIDLINRLSANSYLGRKMKKKGELYEHSYSTVQDLTMQRYGGDHPKNISALNNKYRNVYLLRSIPPYLSPRKIQPPRTDFFSESLWLKKFAEDFHIFHSLLVSDPNNIHIRRKRDRIIKTIIYQIADRLWSIRYLEAGWSESDNYLNLPNSQKIWLDQKYHESRKSNMLWFDSIQKKLSRWFGSAYAEIVGTKALPLGDDLVAHIKNIISECEGGVI